MISRDELVGKFAAALGVEKAESVVGDGVAAVGLGGRDRLDYDEVGDVCEAIRAGHDGTVATIADEIRVHTQAERRFETLLANVPEPAVVVEFDGDEPVVSMINDAFSETFGYDSSAATGRTLQSLIVPEEADVSAQAMWARYDNDASEEIQRRTADGDIRTMLFRSAVVTRETGAIEGYGIYTDITDRKRREQQLHHQNQQLERFVDVVSHDLRNPLEVSLSRLELAQEALDADDPAAEHVRIARESNERMRTMIDDLLSLARQGKAVGEAEPVRLDEVARTAWSTVDTGDATLDVTADRTIEADWNRLAELFENLLRNAVEHCGCPLDTLTVTVGTTRDGFYLEDDGCGIDDAVRESLFDEGVTTAEEGTGLGLSIVETIAEAHGWTVSVGESAAGGARFDFDITGR